MVASIMVSGAVAMKASKVVSVPLPEGALFLAKDGQCPYGGDEPDGLPCSWYVDIESAPLNCCYLRYECEVGGKDTKGTIGPIAKVVIDDECDPQYLVPGVPALTLKLLTAKFNEVPKKRSLHLQFKKYYKKEKDFKLKKRMENFITELKKNMVELEK